MTLILSVLTHDFVIQASDRRLTNIAGATLDDEANKAVLFHNIMVFGYTGYADLPVSERVSAREAEKGVIEHTNLWLARVLNLGKTLDESVQAVESELTESLRRLPCPIKGRQQVGIYGVGWANEKPGNPLMPVFVEITNHEETNDARTAITVLDQESSSLSHASLDISDALWNPYNERLQECLRIGGLPADVGRIMVDAVRKTSGFYPTVGRSVLLSCLPRKQVELSIEGNGWSLDAEEPNLETATFQYFPTGHDNGKQHGPSLAFGKVIGEFVIGPGGGKLKCAPRAGGIGGHPLQNDPKTP